MFSRTYIYFEEILSFSPQLFLFRANCTGGYGWKSFYQLISFISGSKLSDPTVEVSYSHMLPSKIFRMYQARGIKRGAAILLYACPFTIDDRGLVCFFILFFFRISDCRHPRAEYRSVMIDLSKDACWSRNYRSHACTIHCLSATVLVTVVEYYLSMKPQEYSFFPLGF